MTFISSSLHCLGEHTEGGINSGVNKHSHQSAVLSECKKNKKSSNPLLDRAAEGNGCYYSLEHRKTNGTRAEPFFLALAKIT